MTLVMLAIRQLLPPTERYPLPPEQITIELATQARMFKFLDKRVRQGVTVLLHFAYGGAVGGLYALLSEKVVPGGRLPTLTRGDRRVRLAEIVGGTLYALAIWAVSYLGWLPALGMLRPATDHPVRRNILMISAHIVWGATMGLLVDQLAPPALCQATGLPEPGEPGEPPTSSTPMHTGGTYDPE